MPETAPLGLPRPPPPLFLPFGLVPKAGMTSPNPVAAPSLAAATAPLAGLSGAVEREEPVRRRRRGAPSEDTIQALAAEAAVDARHFKELVIDAETHVDLSKLRRAARGGVPDSARAHVWPYLLGVWAPEKFDELTARRRLQHEYTAVLGRALDVAGPNGVGIDSDIARRVRAELKRRAARDTTQVVSPGRYWEVARVVAAQLLTADEAAAADECTPSYEYSPGVVSLASQFVGVCPTEVEAYYCYASLMRRHQRVFTTDGLAAATGRFLMLFRVLQPELYDAFESEEVDARAWVPTWLQGLLARQLPVECSRRLWDTYLTGLDVEGEGEGLELHPYVCLAILDCLQEQLQEVEAPEMLAVLAHLPELDMDQCITRACNYRDDVKGRGLL